MKLLRSRFQTTLFLTFASFYAIMTLVVGLLSYRMTSQAAADTATFYSGELIQQVSEQIDSYLENLHQISLLVQASPDILDFMRAGGESPKSRASANSLRNYLETVKNSRNDINLIALFRSDGEVLLDRDLPLKDKADFTMSEWYRWGSLRRDSAYISQPHVQNLMEKRFPWVISFSRMVEDPETGEYLGILLVDLNFEVIKRLCRSVSLGTSGYLFILDQEGTLIYHPRQQLIYSNLKSEPVGEILSTEQKRFQWNEAGRKMIYSLESQDSSGWIIVAATYPDELIADKRNIQLFYVLLGELGIAVTVVLVMFLSHLLARPIKQLRESMKAVENGQFDVEVPVHSNDEIGAMEKDFNIMVRKVKELMQQIIQEQEQKRKIGLKALESQINPHFLYNTLDSIIWMADAGQQEEVVQMTSALAELFRRTINISDEIIPLKDEVSHIRSYLTIQKMRYRDKLKYEIYVPDELMECQVQKITLQPIVENAIYHGIKNKADSGTVSVTARSAGSFLILEVRDDGPGMDVEILEKLNNGESVMGSGTGLGLRNVLDRLILTFGMDCKMEFISGEEEGTIVLISIPQKPGIGRGCE